MCQIVTILHILNMQLHKKLRKKFYKSYLLFSQSVNNFFSFLQ